MRKGFTLIEMLVYCALFVAVGLLIASVWRVLARAQESATAAYAVTGEVDTALHWLRRDLEETVLGSIYAEQIPSVSMLSARALSTAREPGELWIGEYGVPRWQKEIFWALKEDSPGSPTANLVRWELPVKTAERLPKRATYYDRTIPNDARIMLHNVIMPQEKVPGVPDWTPSRYGGLQVQFVRRANGEGKDYYAALNPCANLVAPRDNTRLVAVQLAVVETLTGKPNFCSVRFKVCPRY